MVLRQSRLEAGAVAGGGENVTRRDWIVLLSILILIVVMIAYFFYAREVMAADLPGWAKIKLILG